MALSLGLVPAAAFYFKMVSQGNTFKRDLPISPFSKDRSQKCREIHALRFVKRILGLRFNVGFAPLGVLLGGEVVDAEGVGVLRDLDEEGDAPSATGARPEALGHPAGLLGAGAAAEVHQLPHGHAVAVADFVVELHVSPQVYVAPVSKSQADKRVRTPGKLRK